MEKLLKKLISFKTETKNPQESRKALNWIKKQVKGLPLIIKEFDSGGFPSLIITTRKTKKPRLWLQSHIDVVEGSKGMFRPKLKGRRIYGRGAFDMKFAIACYIRLLKELGAVLSDYDFGVMITSDEEIGGFNGVKFLLDKGYRSDLCFMPDGGEDWKIEEAAKGVWHLKIESKGVSAHGAYPWRGENALEKLFKFLLKLKGRFLQEPCEKKDHFHNTLNIGKVEGGKAANTVPGSALALIDIRFTPQTSKKDLEKIIRSVQKEFKGVRVEEVIFGESYSIERNNKYLKIFSKIAKEKFNKEIGFSVSHGSSDARFFAEKKIPTILTRPKGGGHHSEEEWIDLDDLEKYYEVLKLFVEKITKK
ncbi:MAG: M20/M25/M40 family metallo-hydrolase [Candidatus Nealsonbacteria bacterium]|nr:M20/M25/M40 family metallo-hydrolase [Candidatus Nealsonbacteria bacterium]